MNFLPKPTKFSHLLAMSALTVAVAVMAGCGVGQLAGPSDVAMPAFVGKVHGGPNPVVGARVVMYATTSTGYGVGQFMQEANQQGTSAHQDTDAGGNFLFPGGVSCPAGEYVYVVSYGGDTGSNANNPNSILMAALGSCSSLYSGTTYQGGNIWIDEPTTIAAGYALSSFLTVTGSSTAGFTVGIGAPTTNHAATGCVGTGITTAALSQCTTTASQLPGLRDAFNNATALVNTTTGVVNATTPNGATVPQQLINTLANSLQACVNSQGGGSTSTLTSNDGTACGMLFSLTGSTAATQQNTLSAMANLAKHPSTATVAYTQDSNSHATLIQAPVWNATCTATGTVNTGTTCLYNIAASQVFYTPNLSAAPTDPIGSATNTTTTDFAIAIQYPKATLGTTTANTVSCNGATPAVNQLLYPFMLSFDIDDNVAILNADTSSSYCYQVLTVTNAGVAIGASPTYSGGTTSLALKWIASDAFGHAIVPAAGANVVNVYTAAGTDTSPALTTSVTSSSAPTYAAVDNGGNIFVTGRTGSATALQQLAVTTPKHIAPAYTDNTISDGSTSASFFQASIDTNGNYFSNSSSSSTVAAYSFIPGASAAVKTGGTGSSSSGSGSAPDAVGNFWIVLRDTDGLGTDIKKWSYTNPPTTGLGTQAAVAEVFPTTSSTQDNVVIDGNGVLWWADSAGSSGVNNGYIRGWDTVNGVQIGAIFGCQTQSGQNQCGDQAGSTSSTPYSFYGTRGLAVDAAGSLWTANGTQGTVTQVIGLASPTLPLFIHNASTSLKP